ncbi:kunitz-type protease inhibitor 3 precursor [Rattus norvegicus]|uniref:kunitz-type protease inhibitor 3 precursor n=1 Tax=Rattus norvegicus TaxID=10116 RepID=UPI0000DA2315|nr:kunitz-type protease inhibitor 3 precursor [Rattus norvegicus]|eukprot:XP_006235690.1 PREDICTED: kunitz-type protease inhibitor 3 [Rattus norvegicus]
MQLQASFSFFLILTFCQELCSEPRQARKSLPSMCTLPMEKGECRAIFVRWYYDTKTKKCDWFHYGGCRGNENNFLSRNQCQTVCAST